MEAHLIGWRRPWALVAVAALAIAACGGDDGGDGRDLRVGYAFGIDLGDTGDMVAFDRVARETDIEPTFEETGGRGGVVAALTRGNIDVAKMSFEDAINAIAQGADLRILMAAHPLLDLVLVGGAGVETLTDLRGKRIFTPRPEPSISLSVLRPALEEAGVDESDYAIEFLEASESRAAALVAGRADAAILESVDVELLGDEVELTPIIDVGRRAPNPSLVFVASSEFVEENRALLQTLTRELLAGYESLYGPEGRDAWAERAREGDLAGESEEVAARIYENHRRIGYWPRGGPPDEAQHQRALDLLIEFDLVEEPVPFGDAWDVSFWQRAAEG